MSPNFPPTCQGLLLAFMLAVGGCADSDEAAPAQQPTNTLENIGTVETGSLPAERPVVVLAKIEQSLRNGDASYATRSELTDYVDRADAGDLLRLAQDLWGGRNAVRDRETAARLSSIAYAKNPRSDIALYAGIGHLNGLGVERDPNRAADILSQPELRTDPAATYFLALAYRALDRDSDELDALQRAAALGHDKAQSDLSRIQR